MNGTALNSRLGIIARADFSGLGSQTRNLTYMLKPSKVMLIDSTPFKRSDGFSYEDAKQHPEWYEGFNGIKASGFPRPSACRQFVNGLTHILTCETFYNPVILGLARARNIKTFLMANYEFTDYINHPHLPRPDKILMPSYWHLEEMQALFSNVEYLPPPLFPQAFRQSRDKNLARKDERRFLHIIGKLAVKDRNGTLDLLEALKHTKADFELVIRSQYPLPKEYESGDPRVKFEVTNLTKEADLYADFDALILPRRYGGLCLPMNEALMSALPVIMPEISPNTRVLPVNWLIPAKKAGSFIAKMEIDYYQSDLKELADKLTELAEMPGLILTNWKMNAFELGMHNYSADILRPRYEEVMEL